VEGYSQIGWKSRQKDVPNPCRTHFFARHHPLARNYWFFLLGTILAWSLATDLVATDKPLNNF
jgi:hypothetical protein